MSKNGYFGNFGGTYVPEILVSELAKLEYVFYEVVKDAKFKKEFTDLLVNFAGRPTPLVFAQNLTKFCGGAKIYFKNEGANHTGAHKITHCIGQMLVAKRLGKTRIIAETGAGQHGVATAAVAAKLGLKCVVYMGESDVNRQRPNVLTMKLYGAEVIPVKDGSMTLKDAVNAALKDWVTNSQDTHYILGSVVGPHPFPTMNAYFQKIVGKEIAVQLLRYGIKNPNYIVACVGGGSNAMGAFGNYLKNKEVKLVGVEAGGTGFAEGQNSMRIGMGSVGVVEGYKSYFKQNSDGQIGNTKSIAAGLDYPGIGPELAHLANTKRVKFVNVSDADALSAVKTTARLEGIVPALESAHAIAYAIKQAGKLSSNKTIVVNVSGRGDKDLFILAKASKDVEFYKFLENYLNENYKK